MSSPGSDVIGYKSGPDISPKDEVFVIEVKGWQILKAVLKDMRGYKKPLMIQARI